VEEKGGSRNLKPEKAPTPIPCPHPSSPSSSRHVVMLFLLLVYAISQSGFGEAVPTPSIDARDTSSGGESIQTRTVWNIVWSCLSTIFLCTWSSLHPNISSIHEEPGTSWFKKRLKNPFVDFLTYKLPLFLCALLVPEYILAWAIRQYFMAGTIQKKGELNSRARNKSSEIYQFQAGLEHMDSF
jgi:hypothetical protein